ncbi:hypothetical protein GCM10010394_67650 [Streptomyces crystallinus]|uniref:Uncharacterized protein n=1 Tax=Streptomyces crystallinus TaxID=68191 RepID=A0ABN1H2J7_9ACTN
MGAVAQASTTPRRSRAVPKGSDPSTAVAFTITRALRFLRPRHHALIPKVPRPHTPRGSAPGPRGPAPGPLDAQAPLLGPGLCLRVSGWLLAQFPAPLFGPVLVCG